MRPMTTPLLALAVVLMLFGAAMLIADVVGVSALWIAIIAIGIAVVVLQQVGGRPSHR